MHRTVVRGLAARVAAASHSGSQPVGAVPEQQNSTRLQHHRNTDGPTECLHVLSRAAEPSPALPRKFVACAPPGSRRRKPSSPVTREQRSERPVAVSEASGAGLQQQHNSASAATTAHQQQHPHHAHPGRSLSSSSRAGLRRPPAAVPARPAAAPWRASQSWTGERGWSAGGARCCMHGRLDRWQQILVCRLRCTSACNKSSSTHAHMRVQVD